MLKTEQEGSEYKLTYQGKTIAKLDANTKITPAEALVEFVNALVGYAFGGDEDE